MLELNSTEFGNTPVIRNIESITRLMQTKYKQTLLNRWQIISPQKPNEYKGQRTTQDDSAINTFPYSVRALQVCKFQSRHRLKNRLLIN